jgi:hypothetical protein
VRKRRNNNRAAAGAAADIVGAIASAGLRLWAKAARRPVGSLAILGAGATSLVIIVNAVFLQSRPHPAPFVANPALPPQAAENRPNVAVMAAPKSAQAPPARSAASSRMSQTVSARRNDPIAELIGSSIGAPSRVMAVQRVLAEFGYGQVRPSGIVDEATGAAIEKFEGEHKLPVTGRLSDRLLSELAIMTGRPIE